jgi:hypothetical protein
MADKVLQAMGKTFGTTSKTLETTQNAFERPSPLGDGARQKTL